MAIRMFVTLLAVSGFPLAQPRPATGPTTTATTRPTTRPPVRPTTRPATRASTKISPEAQALLNQLNKAYTGLKSLELEGTISSELDIAGLKEKNSVAFTSVYQSPMMFRHEVAGDMLAGCTGEKGFMFKPVANMYKLLELPKDKPAARAFPSELARLLELQNPSLLLALVKDPAEAVKSGVQEISRPPDAIIDSVAYRVLKLSSRKGAVVTTLLIDPKTNLLKRAVSDLTGDIAQLGAPNTRLVTTTVDYVRTVIDGPAKAEGFAWTPPDDARDAGMSGAAALDDVPSGAPATAKVLVGKTAPEFRLPDLDGKDVSLGELKGKVVILAFWSAGAGPSAAVLPRIQESAAGRPDVTPFAICVKDEVGQIRLFAQQHKLTMPVLRDDGAVQTAYGAAPLPVIFIVDKDGVVQKVIGGSVDNLQQQLREAIDAALSGK